MAINQPLILITDLDGTLLDHDTYRYDAARPALQQLKRLQIPLILSSSKTAAEVLAIREEINNNYPFIVENGSGIYYPANKGKGYPDYEVVRLGTDRASILAVPRRFREELKLPFSGFNDMSVEAIMKCTGLTENRAARAKQREFTEPLLWQGSAA